MARTDARGVTPGSEITLRTQELALAGMEKGLWDPKDLDYIFATVAKACEDPRDRWLFLKTCQAHGLSPIKRELHATSRWDKNLGRNVVVFVTSYYVFVSRARSAGFLIQAGVVYAKDDFIWDGEAGKPAKHLFNPATNRGELVGGYAFARDAKTGAARTGNYWPKEELLSQGKNPLRDQMPEHFVWKTAVCRIARLVAPNMESLYAPEEFGHAVFTPEDLPDDAPQEVRELASLPPEEQTRRQAESEAPVLDIQPEITEPTKSESEQEAVEDRPIDFPTRVAVMKGLALDGHTTKVQIAAALKTALGREVSDPKNLRHSDLPALAAIIAKGAQE